MTLCRRTVSVVTETQREPVEALCVLRDAEALVRDGGGKAKVWQQGSDEVKGRATMLGLREQGEDLDDFEEASGSCSRHEQAKQRR